MNPQQVATMFADIHAKLEAQTQIMTQTQERLGRVEKRIENHNEYKEAPDSNHNECEEEC